MLISEPRAVMADPILSLLGAMNEDSRTRIIKNGMYEVQHFGSSSFLPGYEQYPKLDAFAPYGVVDYPEQLLEKIPMIEASVRKFVCVFTRVTKSSQSPEGGWRWHKWGPYIGDKEPTTEYLYDEPDIEEIFTYRVYELS